MLKNLRNVIDFMSINFVSKFFWVSCGALDLETAAIERELRSGERVFGNEVGPCYIMVGSITKLSLA